MALWNTRNWIRFTPRRRRGTLQECHTHIYVYIIHIEGKTPWCPVDFSLYAFHSSTHPCKEVVHPEVREWQLVNNLGWSSTSNEELWLQTQFNQKSVPSNKNHIRFRIKNPHCTHRNQQISVRLEMWTNLRSGWTENEVVGWPEFHHFSSAKTKFKQDEQKNVHLS